MAKSYTHTHVSFVSRAGRRRSQSLSIPATYEEDTAEQSMTHKQFLAQLRQKDHKHQDEHEGNPRERDDRAHTVVTRVGGGGHDTVSASKQASAPLKKQISSTGRKTHVPDHEDHHHQANGTHISRGPTLVSMKKPSMPMGYVEDVPKDEITSVSSGTMHSGDHEHHPHTVRIPQSETKMSLNRQISNKTSHNSDHDPLTISKVIRHDSSKTLSHIFQSSSIDLIPKSEIFDQDFHLDDPSHTRKNLEKKHGKINISGREKNYINYDRKMAARSSASCMGAVIAMVIGLIAFAFGLTALILVLLLRSSVETKFATMNATASNAASTTDVALWTLACSNYTRLTDPSRGVSNTGYALNCDNTFPFINRTMPVWIRFTGAGGTTLPLTTPGMNICGSEGTGWYDGTMPSSGEIVNGTACFTWYNAVCRFSQPISVANCGSYYTYLLPPAPACMMRYCTI